jgi:hypothetical protein
MADILKDLLQAYYDDVSIERKSGGNLTSILSHYIIQQPILLPPDFSAELPCLLIYPGTIPVRLGCLGGYSDLKQYEITLTLLKEGFGHESQGLFGDEYNVGLLAIMQDIETLYRRETFDLSLAARTTRIDYRLLRLEPFLHRGIHQGHITFVHEYMDLRSS